ncbi:MAG: hypothetical protein HYU70_14520 [Bacteroidetes bacterium]|nr:hypothetical protein [Bacteroidota bacterium]
MYSLAGFIQLLLILSQSDYLPDLSAVWEKRAIPVMTVPPERNNGLWQVPVTVTYYPASQPVAGNDQNKWMLLSALQRNGCLQTPPSNTVPAGRVISSDKLYLMFCRLKIGG